MSIRSLADFNRSSLGGDSDWLTPPPSPPRPQTLGRHDERGVGTFNWPPARTTTWPHAGTFSWPRTRVRVALGAQIVQVKIHIRNYCCSNDLLLAGNHSYLIYSLADGWQIALTRQNDGPGCLPQGWAAIGSQTGSQRHAVKPVHRGCSCRPVAPLGRSPDHTGGAWLAASARPDAVSRRAGRRLRVRPIGRASRILTVIHELPVGRCSKSRPHGHGQANRTPVRVGGPALR
jgi:hypothetical protein